MGSIPSSNLPYEELIRLVDHFFSLLEIHLISDAGIESFREVVAELVRRLEKSYDESEDHAKFMQRLDELMEEHR